MPNTFQFPFSQHIDYTVAYARVSCLREQGGTIVALFHRWNAQIPNNTTYMAQVTIEGFHQLKCTLTSVKPVI